VELLDSVGIIFIELTKLGGVMKKPVEEMTPAEMWSLFYAVGNDPKHRRLLEEMIKAKEEIGMAVELLTNISRDPDERARYMSRRKFQMDMDHNLVESRNEGKLEGMREVARNLMGMNMPLADITKATGLSSVEIEKLKVGGGVSE
jgi:predicted transposase/invertase (TIGR01784 family)